MAWFLVKFWQRLTTQLVALAKEANGKVLIGPPLERATLVATLTPYTDIPRSLELFLEAHLATPTAQGRSGGESKRPVVVRAFDALIRVLRWR